MSSKTESEKSLGFKLNSRFFINIYAKYGIFLILLLLVLILSIATQNFLNQENLINIVRQVSFVALLALGVTIIIITTGIDLSSGSVLAVSAVVTASLAKSNNVYIAILVGLAVGALCGLINGFVVAQSGIPPFIVTLGMMTAARGAAMLISNGKPISITSEEIKFLGAGYIGSIPVPIIILVLMSVITFIMLNHTKFGRHIYALGGNEQAAIISGINVKKVKIIIYAYAGLLGALAGIALTGRIYSGQPSLGTGYELDAIASAVIGGTSLSSGGIGTVQGTVIGALIIGVINNGMDLLKIDSYWQQIVKALIIVGAVLLDKQKSKL